MKETNDMNARNKENTIDILVTPKKQEPVPEKKSAPAPKPSAAKKQNAQGKAKPATPVAKPATSAAKPVTPAVKPASSEKPAASKRKKTVPDLAGQTRKGLPVGTVSAKKPSAKLPVKSKKKEKKPVPDEDRATPGSLASTLVIALVYIAVVVGISAILSVCGIRWANDIFALVKDEVVATVTIPENATVSEVSTILKENKLIKYPAVFRFYINFKNRDADPPLAFKAGEYELSSTLNYDQIVSMIKDRKRRSIVTITIPEGFTVDEVIDLFISQGMGTREGFVDAINNFDYDYTFMKKLNETPLKEGRKYRLEGYLFPDTYDFYTDSGEVAIIDKLLAAFEAHFESEYYARLEEIGMTLDEVVTLASIVQKEGKFNSDFYPVAGVFYNRLRSNNMKRLQSDATVQYCLEERKQELTYADLEVESPYNTYRNAGLPPSAIANPGWDAIQATLYPESHKHYYFVSDTDGSMIFADTEPQHLANAAKVREAKEKGTSVD